MEEEVLNKIKKGDQHALAEVLKDHYEFLFKYTVQLTGNKEMAKDITQETMVKVIHSIHKYEKRAKFSTWIIQIATNIFLDMKRKEKRRKQYLKENEGSFDFKSNMENGWSETLEVLSSLEDSYRIPILLKHLYGYEYKEIGQMIGLKAGTVKSRVHYGLELLRKEMQGDE
ncbi:RNA polymerase sigma factor SigY [Pontibacillus salipaludis]|uniref:RNA polymerase sigma factor SigY n=1 Tax=Pontibacillus salipaludis TaxID=1697394 RepID=A0ABQ1PLB7_9BACI|nr:RNA polymerase sigma factor SigY [Pontibacillus salipaludis]GGC99230.1 RNA polymerase sigma factor SigY [Pontibacillus salipaludis]